MVFLYGKQGLLVDHRCVNMDTDNRHTKSGGSLYCGIGHLAFVRQPIRLKGVVAGFALA